MLLIKHLNNPFFTLLHIKKYYKTLTHIIMGAALTKEKFISDSMKIVRPLLTKKQISGMGIAHQLGVLFDLCDYINMSQFKENLTLSLSQCTDDDDVIDTFSRLVKHNNSLIIQSLTEGVLVKI